MLGSRFCIIKFDACSFTRFDIERFPNSSKIEDAHRAYREQGDSYYFQGAEKGYRPGLPQRRWLTPRVPPKGQGDDGSGCSQDSLLCLDAPRGLRGPTVAPRRSEAGTLRPQQQDTCGCRVPGCRSTGR